LKQNIIRKTGINKESVRSILQNAKPAIELPDIVVQIVSSDNELSPVTILDNTMPKLMLGKIECIGAFECCDVARERRNTEFKVGDIVIFLKRNDIGLPLDEHTRLFMKESDILAIIKQTINKEGNN
jgi:co-chaperonin GroES (HSP10)